MPTPISLAIKCNCKVKTVIWPPQDHQRSCRCRSRWANHLPDLCLIASNLASKQVISHQTGQLGKAPRRQELEIILPSDRLRLLPPPPPANPTLVSGCRRNSWRNSSRKCPSIPVPDLFLPEIRWNFSMPSSASACAWSLFLEEEDCAGLICLLCGCRLLFGYAMPALECFKAIEQRPGRADQLRFWCEYW